MRRPILSSAPACLTGNLAYLIPIWPMYLGTDAGTYSYFRGCLFVCLLFSSFIFFLVFTTVCPFVNCIQPSMNIYVTRLSTYHLTTLRTSYIHLSTLRSMYLRYVRSATATFKKKKASLNKGAVIQQPSSVNFRTLTYYLPGVGRYFVLRTCYIHASEINSYCFFP
ncbi:hypothetical protein GGS21DRAFT_270801 [Xylaria nigripes]|nr:hypothetical protein GGS21DRAFT_270801 [Xylaria nigripes]